MTIILSLPMSSGSSFTTLLLWTLGSGCNEVFAILELSLECLQPCFIWLTPLILQGLKSVSHFLVLVRCLFAPIEGCPYLLFPILHLLFISVRLLSPALYSTTFIRICSDSHFAKPGVIYFQSSPYVMKQNLITPTHPATFLHWLSRYHFS